MTDKRTLRRELLALRNAIPPRDKQVWDAKINDAILNDAQFRQSQAILAYCPVGSEPDIRPALEEALRLGKALYLPKCKPGTREMTFHRIDSLENLRPGAYGIPEPEENNWQLFIVHCQLCIVPGVAFDAAGFRLGYGGGYYDRFLARHARLRTLGVCYGVLLCASLPRDDTDIAVERVLTEQ
ncbi:MAG: 5-formyltetrahydrofolate cyclo-ligase [Oscillospiraceae bacterium]|nr:5-formyltetrahydrofolate cyclo-ligase [Oscillospiraceae bacterium]